MTNFPPPASLTRRVRASASSMRLLVGLGLLSVAGCGPVHAGNPLPLVAAAAGTAEELEREAATLENRQHWLGAVTQWRACLRRAPEGSDLQRKALEHLRELAGIAWRVRIESKNPKPLVVGKTVLAIPYEVTDGSKTRSMVTAVDRLSGKVLWTREDALAYLHDGDLLVFAETRKHLARVNLQNGLDLWQHPFGAATANKPLAQNRHILEIQGSIIYVLADTWPRAVDLDTGSLLWSEHPRALPGYQVISNASSFICWPGPDRPASVSEADWQSAPLVRISKVKGELLWQRSLLSGEPWKVIGDDERVYISNPRLETERPWTALSMERGQTIWRLPQAEARSSTLTPLTDVLVEEGAESPLVRVIDPLAGRRLWQSDKVIRTLPQGLALAHGDNDSVAVLKIRDGKPSWQVPQEDTLRLDPSHAVAHQGLYMTAAHAGALSGGSVPGAIKYKLEDGTPIWRLRGTESPYEDNLTLLGQSGETLLCERSMLIARPRLDAPTSSGVVPGLLALDANKGEVRWGLYGFRALRSVPFVRTETALLVGEAEDGGHSIYCFDLGRIEALVKTGRQWWWTF